MRGGSQLRAWGWIVSAVLLASGAAGGTTAASELSAEEIELKVVIQEQSDEMIETLGRWVDMNTGSFNLEGLEALAPLLAERLEALGFDVEIRPGAEVELPDRGSVTTGPLVLGRRAAATLPEPPASDLEAPSAAARRPLRLLLSGHYDTVFEPESPFQRLSRQGDRPLRATGPGVADMKGGIVVMLCALHALHESGDLQRASWTVLFNADEEIGSLGTRSVIEEEARQADVGLVFEAAHRGGAMVRSRRGLGQFHLQVRGVAAHAGNAHSEGRSAVRELAEKILAIEALTNYERGRTLNVGTIRGGTKRNIVPDSAEAWIDLRYDAQDLGEEARRELERVAEARSVEGTETRLWGTLHRPAKAATNQTGELLDRHARIAEALGVALPPAVHAGGGTDGSLMGAVGLPALDSLGVRGGNSHTDREFVELDSLTERAAIAAIFLRRLLDDPLYARREGG